MKRGIFFLLMACFKDFHLTKMEVCWEYKKNAIFERFRPSSPCIKNGIFFLTFGIFPHFFLKK